ncbi:MAG: transglutaminase [Nostoc sp. JL34]|uniref:transglutaminase domain-containing protein n=1 Tax=Nostoc sp. JL34 TaxID=2815397 RepID=UPI001D795C59|nr:transglutaminase domain-containing protein [Nostoc sp. JL34]MBN3884816.1 transglutaminase [Nostoc sp. JL34]
MAIVFQLIGRLIKWTAIAIIYLTPVLGVWLASSLAAYNNRSTSLAVLAGVFLFPILPLLWELRAQSKGSRSKERILTWGDRLTLRTLVINFVAIAALLVWQPRLSFVALSTRGDWMLGNLQGQPAQLIRQNLFKLANGLEGMYLSFNTNPFERYDDGSSKVQPQPQTNRDPFENLKHQDAAKPQPANNTNGWAWQGMGIHPAVANMPSSVETSIASVAQYIVSKESDPVQRIKALHDYVADRIAYDAESYFAGQYPPQDAETVFRTRKSVCAGYAKLLEALGKAAGEEIIYVVGDARTQTSDLSGQGHAWNAARVKGQWYLIDATWDSGYVDRSSGFTKNYRTEYLMPPPEVMVISHFPKDPAWQLLSNPLPLGEFLRQPMMKPKFFADGLQLVSPVRSQTNVGDEAKLVLANPKNVWLLASYNSKGGGNSQSCGHAVQGDQVTCKLPASGSYEMRLFTSTESQGEFNYVGQLEFNKS